MIHITLTGEPTISTGSIRVDRRHLGGPQARTAFGMLVLGRQRGVHRDELADAIWPERLPVTWEAALRLVISRVRAFLAAGALAQSSALANSSGIYRLHLPAGTVVDVEAAADAVAEAERAVVLHRWSEAERHAKQAHDTLARPFLAGCGGPWIEHERERLLRLEVRSLEIMSQAALAEGRTAAAVAAASEAIGHEPYRESAHRIVIESHLAAGQRAEALAAYTRCRQLLVEHLGVDPSPVTAALYPRVVGSSGIPAGRRREWDTLSRVWERVRRGTTEVVVVRGEAGAGKSHLLSRFAKRSARDRALVVTDAILDADVFVAGLAARAGDGPTLMVVDDIHATGPAAHRAFQLIARGPRSAPLLLLAAGRDSVPEAAVTEITLEPLTEQDVAELAEAIGVDASRRKIRVIHHQSGGNARLATELLRSGELVSAVDRHLEGLSDESLELLMTAARVGEQFELRTVQEQLTLDEDTVLDALDELIAARLIASVPREPDTCTFRHPIVRSVLVARLPRGLPA